MLQKMPQDSPISTRRHRSSVVAIRPEGGKDPLFLIHGVDGSVARFQTLVRYLEPDQPVYGIQSQALLGDRIALTRVEDLAAYYLKDVQAVKPHGPYHFVGFSYGGLVAFEMARQLHSLGEPVGMLGMLDNRRMALSVRRSLRPREDEAGHRRTPIRSHVPRFLRPTGLGYMREKLRARGLRTIYTMLNTIGRPIPRFLQKADEINWFAAVRYSPQWFPGRITLFQATETLRDQCGSLDEWSAVAGDGAEIREISGSHEDVLKEPYVQLPAKEITACLAAAHRTK